MFLISKYTFNEDFINKICDPFFVKNGAIKHLGEKILEKKTQLENKFRSQFMTNEYSVRKIMLARYNEINSSILSVEEPLP
jgi:hypothetical protein